MTDFQLALGFGIASDQANFDKDTHFLMRSLLSTLLLIEQALPGIKPLRATCEDFERLVAVFEPRSVADRERFDGMMRYAEATSCRKQ